MPFALTSDLDSRSSDQQAALDSASAVVRSIVGWHVWPSRTETVTVDGSASGVVFLPTLHLTDVTSVTSGGTAVTDFEWAQAGYLRSPRFTTKRRSVTATITHGYDERPRDLADVVMAMAEAIMEDPTGTHTNERADDYGVGYGGLSAVHRTVLARHTVKGA